jgi:hypothetical protein
MSKIVHHQVFVPLPLLRAIEQLPERIHVDGITVRFTGEVTSAPIILDFAAHRAFVECNGHRGWVDLSSASSSRCEMTLRIGGLRATVVDRLVLALRAAMIASQTAARAVADERIDVCRSA